MRDGTVHVLNQKLPGLLPSDRTLLALIAGGTGTARKPRRVEEADCHGGRSVGQFEIQGRTAKYKFRLPLLSHGMPRRVSAPDFHIPRNGYHSR